MSARGGVPHSPIVLRAMQAIEQHLGEFDLTANRVAKFAGISLRYLQHLFAAAGETPTRYIRLRRLQKCCQDMLDPGAADQSIAEISQRWGFSDPAYFSRVFRRYYGVAPSQYRSARRDLYFG